MDIKSNPESLTIKDIDWKIIQKLKKDSRATALDLSKGLKLNVETVLSKIRNLKKKGIIGRFYPIIDMNKLGYKEYTFISRIDPSYKKELDGFIEYAQKDPRFIIVIKAVGYVNLYYAFLVENNEELREIREKVDKLLGKSVIENYKIEVENMVS